MYNFEYVRPASLKEAAKALASNGEATLLAGGQTLLPTLRQRLAQPSALVDLSGISELSGISLKGNTLEIGATTSHAAVAASKDVNKAIPALAHLASTIGDSQVRHRGTIGGSLANNDPAADYPAAEGYYERAITLPLFPCMTEQQVGHVIRSVRAVWERHRHRIAPEAFSVIPSQGGIEWGPRP